MDMKQVVLAAALAAASGCTYHSAIAQGPSADKVFITKTTSYILWSSNKMELCSWANNRATNCTEVTED
jgi:hypothetical protein